MCDLRRNIATCEWEDSEMPREYALGISFTDTALRILGARMFGAHSLWGSKGGMTDLDDSRFPDLGMSYHKKYPMDDPFWYDIREAVITHIVSFESPKYVFLLGITLAIPCFFRRLRMRL